MPLSGRPRPDGDKERSAKAQEQELKRARGAISCAECRRLKLKCDKTVPCSSCKRRGCASICPNGSLTTGQGTRFILADTDRLHRKIAEMSDRIRQLEDGLAILQSSVTREPHPLLDPDLVKIKSGLELHSATRAAGGSAGGGIEAYEDAEEEEEAQYIDAFGTLAMRDDGAATFYGRSAGSESLLLDEKPHLAISTLAQSSSAHPDLPPELNRLAATFPSGPADIPLFDLQELIHTYLPSWQRAAQLRDLYLEQAPWFFGAVSQRQVNEEVLPLFYEEAAEEARARVQMGASAPSSDVTGKLGSSAEAFNLPTPSTQPSSHDLALMLVLFCFGALTDPTLPPAPHNEEASRYYQLTRAALSLEPVLDRPPSVTTVQTLSLMGIYQGMVADEHSIETTWALMGLSSKLAQSVSLHRDSARWKLSSSEVQKRRALFWELSITDSWQALATGRLPTFVPQFVDTELPADPDQTLADDGTPQPSFPVWKARWGKECVSSVVMGTLTAQAPKYSIILDLDRRIRDMTLPRYALGAPPQNAGLAQTMSHYMPTNYLHLTLLYVHRCFFAQAIIDSPLDPMRSQYAPSFLAGYRSACALLGSIRDQFVSFPVQIARFWVLWTHAFSACVMMGSVVTRGGTSKTAQAALSELRLALDLFERAATHGGRARKFLPVVRKMHEKAQASYFKGFQPLRRDIFGPRVDESDVDELSIFSGRTARTVATKSNRPQRISPSASSAGTPSDNMSGKGSQAGSDARNSQSPAAEAFPALESSYRAAIHPGLVDELRTFEGQLEAQIHQGNEYYAHLAPEAQQMQGVQPTQGYNGQEQGHMQPVHPQHPQQQQQAYDQRYQVPPQHQHDNISQTPGHLQQEYPVQYTQTQTQHYPPPNSQPPSRRASYHASMAVPQQAPPPVSQQQIPIQGVDHHDIPVYGGFSRAPSQHQYDAYGRPVSSSAHQADGAYSTHAVPPVQHPELWNSNVLPQTEPPPEPHMSQHHQQHHQYAQPQMYHSPLEEHVPPPHAQYGQHIPQPEHHQPHPQHYSRPAANPHSHGYTQAHPHVHPHAQAHPHPHPHAQPQTQAHVHPTPVPDQYTQGQQYAYTQGVQQMVPPPPAPLIQVHTGGYSLQETWTSFIQQELPAPPGGGVHPQSLPAK
ncbi:fungal-specific transcription factor domain-containing protein [Trametes gibbosa]|nr:fungal-specific transcription factor domain-containing protein [Trametes gibbosa]